MPHRHDFRERSPPSRDRRASSVPRAPAVSSRSASSAAMTDDRAALPGHAEPDRRLRKIGGEGLQEGGERRFERQAMRAGRRADGDRIGAVGGQALAGPHAASRSRRRCGRPRPAASFRVWRSREPASASPSSASSSRSPPADARRQPRQTAPRRSSPSRRRSAAPSHVRRLAASATSRHRRRVPARGCS